MHSIDLPHITCTLRHKCSKLSETFYLVYFYDVLNFIPTVSLTFRLHVSFARRDTAIIFYQDY